MSMKPQDAGEEGQLPLPADCLQQQGAVRSSYLGVDTGEEVRDFKGTLGTYESGSQQQPQSKVKSFADKGWACMSVVGAWL